MSQAPTSFAGRRDLLLFILVGAGSFLASFALFTAFGWTIVADTPTTAAAALESLGVAWQ